ncbi:MAG: type III secretion system chaperone [Xanthomonadales bacterium]|nr:type III secretion system chaperone [Xanthomonadales bacterium]
MLFMKPTPAPSGTIKSVRQHQRQQGPCRPQRSFHRAWLSFILCNFIWLWVHPAWAQEADIAVNPPVQAAPKGETADPDTPVSPDQPEENNSDESTPSADDASMLKAMTAERLGEIIQLIDANAVAQGNSWRFQFQERPLFLVYDKEADRMRLMSPIAEAEQLDEDLLYRMLQANYDAVLDPRYAIARGIVWSAFIHPLSPLSDEQFASAVVQVFTAAETFGTSFSSGGIVFGGGDSQEQHRRLLESLQDLLNPTT